MKYIIFNKLYSIDTFPLYCIIVLEVCYMNIIIIILTVLCSYLYGSIPFALVVGKLFYKKDIRTEGSGNLGGTNAGRVLGSKAGVAVIILDASKTILSIFLTRFICNQFNITTDLVYLSALSCIIGHCYPIFAGFKGGKAVSVAIGYALTINFWAGIFGLLVFFIVLKLSKYVSLSSISGTAAVLFISPFIGFSTLGICTNALILALVIYKHRENITRILNNTERKITWM